VDFAELAVSGFPSMYPAFDCVVLRAIVDISARDLITGQASMGHSGHNVRRRWENRRTSPVSAGGTEIVDVARSGGIDGHFIRMAALPTRDIAPDFAITGAEMILRL